MSGIFIIHPFPSPNNCQGGFHDDESGKRTQEISIQSRFIGNLLEDAKEDIASALGLLLSFENIVPL